MSDLINPPAPPFSAPTQDMAAESAARSTMILGIVGAVYGVLLGWLFPIPSVILGIIGLVKYRKAARNGQATAGLVLAIINTVLGSLYGIVWLFTFGLGLLALAAGASGV